MPPRQFASVVRGGTVLFVWVLAMVSMAPQILGMVESDVGGARPREAILYLNPAHLPEDVARELMAPMVANGSGTQTVFPTVKLTVFYAGADYLLVRPKEHSGANDALFEIPRSAVLAVRWFD